MDLVLYYRPGCPYCQKVLSHMKDADISLPMKNIGEEPYRQELVKIGGKQQVPCLVINGKALYESSDIVQWLKDNHNK